MLGTGIWVPFPEPKSTLVGKVSSSVKQCVLAVLLPIPDILTLSRMSFMVNQARPRSNFSTHTWTYVQDHIFMNKHIGITYSCKLFSFMFQGTDKNKGRRWVWSNELMHENPVLGAAMWHTLACHLPVPVHILVKPLYRLTFPPALPWRLPQDSGLQLFLCDPVIITLL